MYPGVVMPVMVLPCVVLNTPLLTMRLHCAGISFIRVWPDIEGTAFLYPHTPQMWVVRVLTAVHIQPASSVTQITWAIS